MLSRSKIKHPLALFPGRFVVVLDLRQQAFVLRLASGKNCCASYFIFERDSTLVKSLSDEFRNSTSDQIPWKDIAGMRDHLVHGYTTMKKSQIWDTALNDIPSLKKFCEEQYEIDSLT